MKNKRLYIELATIKGALVAKFFNENSVKRYEISKASWYRITALLCHLKPSPMLLGSTIGILYTVDQNPS